MKTCKAMLWLCCLVLLTTSVVAQEKLTKVKIYPPADREQRNQLLGHLEVDHFFEQDGAIITEITQRAAQKLKEQKVKHAVLIPDVAQYLQARNERFFKNRAQGRPSKARVALEQPGSTIDAIIPTPATFEVKSTFGGYYSFSEMVVAMNALVAAYPSIASKTSIGKTAEGRDIWVIKISDNVGNDDANEPEILYMGLQHAREAIGGASMIFFMQYLCENYAKDTRIKALVDNREFFIIPCFNPDGWEYNRLNGGVGAGWRKNRSKVDSVVTISGPKNNKDTTVTYTYGVDLNRNWGVDWSNCAGSTSCGSGTPSAETYYGSSAFSELETEAVRQFTKKHHFVAGFDQHAFGPYYSLPFGRKGLHTMSQKGNNFYTAIPALMGAYNGMRAADSYDALGYQVAGGFKDWMLMGELGATSGTGRKDSVWAMTGEGGAGGGTGGDFSSFWAPADQIENLSKGMCYQNLQLAYAAGTYVDIQDANDIGLANTTGSLNVTVKRLGLGNDPVTVTLVPLENIQNSGASFVTINSMAYYDNLTSSLSYKLPNNIQIGQRVRYIWQVSTAGYSYADTVVKFYQPTILFSDNMEGANVATNWNISGSWNYSTDKAYSGSKALTESPGSNYTASTQSTATYKNTLDLRDVTAAYLTFWTRHRAENFRDKLQVQVSTNNGSTWVPLVGLTTKQEPGTLDGNTLNGQPSLTGIQDYWTREVFDLSAYNTQSALQFRFLFSSNNDGTSTFLYKVDEGFYIDNLSVMKSMASPTPLPVKFIAVTAKPLPNKTVSVAWDAIADQQHDYFEVERSENGSEFINLGKANIQPPYQFIDKAPAVGTNFYRIKQIDKDGKVSYSKVVSVIIEHDTQVTLFPNPVKDKLTVKVSSVYPALYSVQVTDLQGQVVHSQQLLVQNAETITIPTQIWKAQTYIIKVINEKDEIISMQKLIKL